MVKIANAPPYSLKNRSVLIVVRHRQMVSVVASGSRTTATSGVRRRKKIMVLLTLPDYSNLIFIVCSRRHQGVNDGIKLLAKDIAEREAYQARSFVGR